jgi:hypothetical protein
MSNSRTPQRKKAIANRRLSPSQRQIQTDQGTPESKARRQDLIGTSADPHLAVDPIGILMARGQLGADPRLADARLRAGRRFADLRRGLFGAMTPQATLLYRAVTNGAGCLRPTYSDDQQNARYQAMRASYETALATLSGRSPRTLRETVHLCHWGDIPDWSRRLFAGTPYAGDQDAQATVIDGLDALVQAFGFGRVASTVHVEKEQVNA